MDAYPATQSYIAPEKLNPPGVVRRLSADELNRPKSPLELMIAQGDALPKTGTGAVSAYNPREEFRRLGWEVYDQKNWDGAPRPGVDVILNYGTPKDKFSGAVKSNQNGIKNLLTGEEARLFDKLIGDTPNSDYVFASFVTPEGKVFITIQSTNNEIGKNGRYIVGKHFTDAEPFRMISPLYGTHIKK